ARCRAAAASSRSITDACCSVLVRLFRAVMSFVFAGCTRIQRPASDPPAGRVAVRDSDRAHVLCFGALSTVADLELDALAFLERLVAVALDCRVVDEDVVALVARDEAVPLLAVEELHSALCHEFSFLIAAVRPLRRSARSSLGHSGPMSLRP